jgi:DNA (cytosine-5)-methyltransferase 1
VSDDGPTYGSLFSGIGGIDLGLDRAGWRCAWQVEIDADCTSVLARHFPDVERIGDVRSARRHNLATVDLVCGGFPCQDVSVAGGRAGLAGPRSGLWHEFRRVVAELAPRWVLIENVPGLLSSWSPVEPPPEPVPVGTWEVEEASDLATVVADLLGLGYGLAWRCLDAQFFGLAQRRNRVFVVGHRGAPWSAPASVLFEPASCAGDPAPRRAPGPGVARALTDGSHGPCAKEQQYTFVSGGGQPLNDL